MKIVLESVEEINFYQKSFKVELKKIINYLKVNKMNKLFKNKIKAQKIFIVFLSLAVVLMQSPIAYVVAQSVPTAPTAPTAPNQPEPTSVPPVAPDVPTAPTLEEFLSPTPTPEQTATPTPVATNTVEPTDSPKNSDGNLSQENVTPTPAPSVSAGTIGTGNENEDGNVGSVTIDTGDANNTGNIITSGNENFSALAGAPTGGATILNEGNGSASTNSGSVSADGSTSNNQTNSAVVTNNMNQGSDTGNNSASKTTGGDVNISTGDANTSGTIVNTLNTNVNGIAIYEFNISDDHMGDYVLNFADTNCVSGCTQTSASAVNSGNGSDSTNSAELDSISSDNSFQSNDATLTNNMYLASNTGDNNANKNTNGNSNITTGDANVEGSVLNFVNNNIEGKVVYAVVNVYGDLIGDIVLPDGTVVACCINDLSAANIGNGSNSTNTANANSSTANNVNQFNNADIQNNLILSAETGENQTDRNTNGGNTIETGDTNIIAQVLNIANTNVIGEDMWLVIVNEAGKWIGRILGAPGGQNFWGSGELEFAVNPNGEVTAMNQGNGDSSTNNSEVAQTSDSNTTQVNNATIVNNIDLSANTGGNSTSRNTGGNNSIKTGDANVVANIVNFVNNNIVGTGRLFVTVVNVFGSWLGDFMGPGQHKDEVQNPIAENNTNSGVGGTAGNGSSAIASTSDNEETSPQNILSTKKAALKKKVLGIASINQTGEGEAEVSINEEPAAETTTADSVPVAGRKVVHINLAFFTPLIPLGIWFVLRKRKLAKVVETSSASSN